MPKLSIENGITSFITRVVIINSSTGVAITTFDHTTSGLVISLIADNEAAWTDYTVAGSLIETITTIGTFAAPTSGKIRFKHVGKGLYEIQAANARWGVSGARSVQMKIEGGASMGEVWAEFQHHPLPVNVQKVQGRDSGVAYGTVGGGSSTTSVVSSALSPAGAVLDQFKDKLLTFGADTTTAALRSASCLISSSTNSATPTFTVSTLPATPASGDTFTIT